MHFQFWHMPWVSESLFILINPRKAGGWESYPLAAILGVTTAWFVMLETQFGGEIAHDITSVTIVYIKLAHLKFSIFLRDYFI